MRYAEVIKNIDPNILLDTENNRLLTKSQSKLEDSFKLTNVLNTQKIERSSTLRTGNIFSFFKGKNMSSTMQNINGSDNISRPPSNNSKEHKGIKNCFLEKEKSYQTTDLSLSAKKQFVGFDTTKTKTFLNMEKGSGNL